MVVTFEDGQITELKGCADRAAAVTYAQTGEVPDAPPITSGVQPIAQVRWIGYLDDAGKDQCPDTGERQRGEHVAPALEPLTV
jgi:hypothetical protein